MSNVQQKIREAYHRRDWFPAKINLAGAVAMQGDRAESVMGGSNGNHACYSRSAKVCGGWRGKRGGGGVPPRSNGHTSHIAYLTEQSSAPWFVFVLSFFFFFFFFNL